MNLPKVPAGKSGRVEEVMGENNKSGLVLKRGELGVGSWETDSLWWRWWRWWRWEVGGGWWVVSGVLSVGGGRELKVEG
jgi:hypothetical protein